MSRNPVLRFVPRNPYSDVSDVEERSDLFICALGYEPRCTHAFMTAGADARDALVIAFPDGHDEQFDASLALYRSKGAAPVEVSDDGISETIRVAMERLDCVSTARISLDVSSFSRLRSAIILEELYEYASRTSLDLEILYSPAVYLAANPVSPLQVLEALPASFSGFGADPELPLVAIVGIGYEEQRALGVIELLEASDAWILVPSGFDEDFDRSIESANELLFERLADRRITYNPSTDSAFHVVQSLAHTLRSEYRVVMVPMGPKIHAVSCMMVSLLSGDRDAVWRASSGSLETPLSVEAAGPIVKIRFATPRRS